MFENDFEKLIIQYRDIINIRNRFIGLVKDFFPGQQMQINLILAAYDIGISKEIENTKIINNAFAYRFVKRLIDEYGISRANADWVVSLWCVCYGQKVLNKNCEIKFSSIKSGGTPSIKEEKTGIKHYSDMFQYVPSSDGRGLAVNSFVGDNNKTIIFQNTYENKPVVEVKNDSFSESNVEEVILTEGFIRIGKKSFYGCTHLKQVVLPMSLKEIEDYSFAGCISLKSISLPMMLSQIGSYAFAGANLKSIKIPKTVYWIGEGAFSDCKNIDDINIEDNINEIPAQMFRGCTSLSRIKLHERLTAIGDFAFAECTSLNSIYIPESVSQIGDNAFAGVNEKFVLLCSYGSYAENYARNKKMKYQLV